MADAWRVVGVYKSKAGKWEIKCFEDGKAKSYYRATEKNAKRFAARLLSRYENRNGSSTPDASESEPPPTGPPSVTASWPELLRETAKQAASDGNYKEVATLAEQALAFEEARPKEQTKAEYLAAMTKEELVAAMKVLVETVPGVKVVLESGSASGQ